MIERVKQLKEEKEVERKVSYINLFYSNMLINSWKKGFSKALMS